MTKLKEMWLHEVAKWNWYIRQKFLKMVSDSQDTDYNRGQSLWNNVKKSSKIGEDTKTLKSVFE